MKGPEWEFLDGFWSLEQLAVDIRLRIDEWKEVTTVDSFVNNARKSKLFTQYVLCVFYDFHTNTDYLNVNQEHDIEEAAWLCVIVNEFLL